MFRNDFGFRATKAILPVAMLCVLSLTLQAEAQEFDLISQQPAVTYTSSVPVYVSEVVGPVVAPATFVSPNVISSQPVYNSTPNYQSAQPGLAQSKAVQAAQMGLRGHLGGGLGGAKYEGVGWSNQSPQDAIEHCCYWGTRPTAQIGVSKGHDGCWYACVLYH